MVYNLGWIYGNFPNYLWTLKDFIITKGCIKSIAKKNKNLEGIFMGHDCYSFIQQKFPNSIPISNQMTKILYILVYNIFYICHLACTTFHFCKKVLQNYDLIYFEGLRRLTQYYMRVGLDAVKLLKMLFLGQFASLPPPVCQMLSIISK